MKYLCLVYLEDAKFTAVPDRECLDCSDGMRKQGLLLAAEPLFPVTTAKTVRVRDGRMSITDGPFAETKEQLGGIMILEARDLNHAVDLISKHPGAKFGPWEIRPAADLSEMIRLSEERRSRKS